FQDYLTSEQVEDNMRNRIPLHREGRPEDVAAALAALAENDFITGAEIPVSDANPKWLFGKGLRKTFLYGLERCDPAKPLILCESLWAPLWFHEHGLQAAALMGSEMTDEQERFLDPYPTITVALDHDAAGI